MSTEQLPLIQELKAIAEQEVPAEDFQQQVDRWNKYQEALFKVQAQCQVLGLRFRRRIKTSYGERRIKNVKYAMGVATLIAALTVLGATLISLPNPATLSLEFIAGAGAFAFVYSSFFGTAIMLNSGKLPEKMKFTVAASIRYDELFYVQRFIRGMQRERKDPRIELPTLTMELPQAWLKQQALLKIMDSMNGVKL